MKRIISMILSVAMLVSSLLLLCSCSAVNGVNGVDGIDGTDGVDGLIPVIGENGNWWIGDYDTGVNAKGEKGDKGDTGPRGDKSTVSGPAGNDASASAPKFRVNFVTNNIEVSYDAGKTWQSCGTASNSFDANADLAIPMDMITVLDGYIDSSGKYVIASSADGGRHGAIIDVSAFAENYSSMKIERNSNKNHIEYAFITSDLIENETPAYSNGFTKCKMHLSKTLTVEIPEGAKYLYVTYNALSYVHVPSSITFVK